LCIYFSREKKYVGIPLTERGRRKKGKSARNPVGSNGNPDVTERKGKRVNARPRGGWGKGQNLIGGIRERERSQNIKRGGEGFEGGVVTRKIRRKKRRQYENGKKYLKGPKKNKSIILLRGESFGERRPGSLDIHPKENKNVFQSYNTMPRPAEAVEDCKELRGKKPVFFCGSRNSFNGTPDWGRGDIYGKG